MVAALSVQQAYAVGCCSYSVANRSGYHIEEIRFAYYDKETGWRTFYTLANLAASGDGSTQLFNTKQWRKGSGTSERWYPINVIVVHSWANPLHEKTNYGQWEHNKNFVINADLTVTAEPNNPNNSQYFQ